MLAPRILVSKGIALFALERDEEAILCFEESLKILDPIPHACIGLVIAIKEVRGPKEAIAVINRELELLQNNKEVRDYLSLLQVPTWRKLFPEEMAETTAKLKSLRKQYCNELKRKPANNYFATEKSLMIISGNN